MKTDMKIGILVGVVIVTILLVFFVNRSRDRIDKPMTPLAPAQIKTPLSPQLEPLIPELIVEPVTPKPEPKPSNPEVILPLPAHAEPLELQPPPPVEPIEPESETIRQPRYHMVVEGDTLSRISETYYGSGKFWTEILKANRQRIGNPNHLQPGWKLRIPYPHEIAATP